MHLLGPTALKCSSSLKTPILRHGLTVYDRKAIGRKDINAVAKEVIDGKWGNDEERKKKLKEAGYDPAEVQRRVNGMLG